MGLQQQQQTLGKKKGDLCQKLYYYFEFHGKCYSFTCWISKGNSRELECAQFKQNLLEKNRLHS